MNERHYLGLILQPGAWGTTTVCPGPKWEGVGGGGEGQALGLEGAVLEVSWAAALDHNGTALGVLMGQLLRYHSSGPLGVTMIR